MSDLTTKPQPLKISGTFVYSLSSFEPVEMDIVKPLILDEEVEFGANRLLSDHHLTLDEVDDAKIDELFSEQNVHTKADLLSWSRQLLELEVVNGFMQNQLTDKALGVLTERLEQAPAYEEIISVEGMLKNDVDLPAGLSFDTFVNTLPETEKEHMLEDLRTEAVRIVNEMAALNAYSKHFAITAEEKDIPYYLGIPDEHVEEAIADMRANNQLDDYIGYCKRLKSIEHFVNAGKVNVSEESEEESKNRFEGFKTLFNEHFQPLDDECDDDCCCHDDERGCGHHHHDHEHCDNTCTCEEH